MVSAIAWMALGLVAILWSDIFLIANRLKQYSELELTMLSVRHDGINRRMTVWTLCAGASSALLMLLSSYLVWSGGSSLDKIYPACAGSIALGQLVFPVFAKVWGVYPVPKSYRYLVDPAAAVGRLATSQVVVIALVAMVALVGVLWPS